MPLLLSRSDLSRLATNDDELDSAIDAVETSVTQCHSGDHNRVKEARPNASLGVQLDGTTGAVDSLIALDDFNALRTSVPAAVGVRHLAPADAATLTVLGSGVQARSHVRTIRRVMPGLRHLRVWSPTRESRTAFGAGLRTQLGDNVPILAWIRAWADKQRVGTAFNFSD